MNAPATQHSVVLWRQTLLGALLLLAGCSGGSSGGAAALPAVAQGTVRGAQLLADVTVAFIASEDVAMSDSLQPLEDLAPLVEFQSVTDTGGEYRIELRAGRYFIHVTPASGDDLHLPGGSFARESVVLVAGETMKFDIELSQQPSSGAFYIGSSLCLVCHVSLRPVTETLHFLGFRRLTAAGGVPSSLQDLVRFPNADAGLAYYADGNANDNTGLGDSYGFRITTTNGYNILLGVDATGHFQALEAVSGASVSERLYIPFTYGGEGRFKQRYITRLDKDGSYTAVPADASYHVLPAQFNESAGDPAQGWEVTAPGWALYNPERWAAPLIDGGPVGSTPPPEESFDNACAGCHFTGMQLTRNADGLFQARAVEDPGGPIDYDGDRRTEEMNVGCERCHGPGSLHAQAARGNIVNPKYLPPGRANLICGQCHIRGTGNAVLGGLGGGGVPSRNNPSTGAAEFVRPGIAPADFFGTADGSGILPSFGTQGGFLDTIDFTSDANSWQDSSGGFGSARDHSRSQLQHYMDHVRSPHALNAYQLVACWDCHDPHGRELPAQVVETADNNVLCLRCHAGSGDWEEITQAMIDGIDAGDFPDDVVLTAIDDHTIQRTFDAIGVAMNLGPSSYSNPAGTSQLGRCTTCHMPKTARNASWIIDDEGFVIRGDISSHTFDTIAPTASEAMVAAAREPVPNSCVECHRGVLRGAWPDYRFK